jgi:hypothetical protein
MRPAAVLGTAMVLATLALCASVEEVAELGAAVATGAKRPMLMKAEDKQALKIVDEFQRHNVVLQKEDHALRVALASPPEPGECGPTHAHHRGAATAFSAFAADVAFSRLASSFGREPRRLCLPLSRSQPPSLTQNPPCSQNRIYHGAWLQVRIHGKNNREQVAFRV